MSRRPRRRGGVGPLLVLGVVALVPALALLAVFRWADGRVEDDRAAAAPPPPTTIVAPPPAEPPLSEAVMTYRRFPSTISRDLSVARFQDDLLPFLGSLNDRSCVAVSVDGVAVGAQNADLAVIPASNIKIVVAAAALDLLGPDHRYVTSATAAGVAGGVVDGDLYLVGGGDPLLSSAWYPTSNLERRPVTSPTSLDALADSVQAAGVTEVRGNVVGDGTRYDDEFFAPGWGNGVAGLSAGPYDALMANDSRVLGEDQRANDPSAGAAREFVRLLRDRGIVVSGDGVAGAAAPGAEVVATVESAPLTEVVAEMLTTSDNNTAELMVKEIGFAAGTGGTRQAGLEVIGERLAVWGVDTTGVALTDGSGLSLDNRLTCSALLEVLQDADVNGPIGAGLPIAGQTGTLDDVYGDHPLTGRLRGKTGTLNNPPFNADPPAVKALAGYLPIDGGGAVEYVLILNGPTISDQSEYRPVWDEFVGILATYPAGPTPAEVAPRS